MVTSSDVKPVTFLLKVMATGIGDTFVIDGDDDEIVNVGIEL